MQGDVFGEGVVIRARSARWVMVCVVVIAAAAAGCTESSLDEQDLAQDTGSADTRAEDSDGQPLDADAQTRRDALDSDACEGAACGCAKTLESGEVAYEVCGADALCCEQAVEGIFLGCIDPASDQRCGGCGQTRCVGSELCCWSAAEGALSCIDPTDDVNNCGGCAQRGGSDAVDPMFSCGPGQLCERNFNYSLTRPPEEQNASGVFIGQCVIECEGVHHVICPGGINPETSLPYALDARACVDQRSSAVFCGAMTVGAGATETTGQCSERDPQTFGELKNFAGVRCAPSEVCRLKLRCDHPQPLPGTDAAGQPCSPQTHYYYDVAADPAGFPDAQALPDDSVFIPDDTTRGAYIENPYLRAVCDTSCRADQVRCVDASGAPFCIDPNTDPSYCGASLAGSCEDNTATGGADDDGIDCNRELPNTVSAQCVGGACANPVCALGFGDCDGDPANGCEVDLSSPNNLHCGGCSTDAAGVAISDSPRDCANVNSGDSACGGADPASFRCMFCGDGSYDGAGANEACDDGNTVSGDGCSATCQAEAGFNCINLLNMMTTCASSDCGNGVVNTGDMCDPAPAGSLPTATCNIDCTVSACGDGRRNPNAGANEACDDGNTTLGDGCSATCQFETGFVCFGPANGLSYCVSGLECGNGVVNALEQCDPAPPGSLPTATCNADCTFSACGDGKRNPNAGANEACDDGNTTLGDGCSSTCQPETGFACTGPANGLSVCTGAACGNGVINTDEVCDDGNTVNGDGCSNTCQVELGFVCVNFVDGVTYCYREGCGNGLLNPGEACDPFPAGSLPTATCNVDCTVSACGDGRRNPNAGANEACDDGNTTLGDGCSSTCQPEAGFVCAGPANGLSTCTDGGVCGNGLVSPFEQCDPAPPGSLPTTTCNADCTFSACGDGKRNPNAGANEACDDGNTRSGDGCSSCQVDTGFACAGPANGLSICTSP